ncbi:hypothetical protein [Novosphingobium sp. M1R2S20]|uniref:Uncharacterized protein n=1 Tax=Novosphingobium rhizovicinum TaxID=3228928 RepID=A0ABV3REN6_9SPHN
MSAPKASGSETLAPETLPAGFETLEPFVDRWAATTCAARSERRSQSTAEERSTFFDAAAPLLDPALAYLDTRPLPELTPADKRLLNLMLSLGHVQMAVEVHREMEPEHAAARASMEITRSVTDLA